MKGHPLEISKSGVSLLDTDPEFLVSFVSRVASFERAGQDLILHQKFPAHLKRPNHCGAKRASLNNSSNNGPISLRDSSFDIFWRILVTLKNLQVQLYRPNHCGGKRVTLDISSSYCQIYFFSSEFPESRKLIWKPLFLASWECIGPRNRKKWVIFWAGKK